MQRAAPAYACDVREPCVVAAKATPPPPSTSPPTSMPIADPMEDAGAGVFACSRTDPLASALYGARVERRRGASGMDM